MNKSDLVAQVATRTGMSRQQAAEAVNSMLATITAALSAGEDVRLQGFGNFSVGERAATTGRNPATGEQVQIPAAKRPKFAPSKSMKMAINGDPKPDP